jgi:ABC-type sugar transport system substrate-binding protein
MFRFFVRNFSASAVHFVYNRASTNYFPPFAGCLLATLAVSVAISACGCDSSSTFLPPPPDGLRGAAAEESASNINVAAPPRLENAVAGARSVEVIFDRRDPVEIELINVTTRMQAGIEKVKLRTSFLGANDRPSKQADLVRDAVARNALALVIEPADPTDRQLAEAVQSARENGIPVVLLGRPLHATGSEGVAVKSSDKSAKDSAASTTSAKPGANPTLAFTGAKPLVVVAPPAFIASARQLVASAIRNAKNARLDPKGGAVIVSNPVADSFVNERIEAIRSALKENGITAIDEIKSSQPAEAGGKLLIEKLKSNPKIVLVFASDGLSTSVARHAMSELIPDRLSVIAAYPAEGTYGDMIRVGDFAAVAGFVPSRLIRKAITTAVSLAQGHEMPGRVEFAVEVVDSAPDSTTPQSPIYYKAKKAANPAANKSP